jgi:hypothetical protein
VSGHPNSMASLAGSQMDRDIPRRWLLVRRELGVPGGVLGKEHLQQVLGLLRFASHLHELVTGHQVDAVVGQWNLL